MATVPSSGSTSTTAACIPAAKVERTGVVVAGLQAGLVVVGHRATSGSAGEANCPAACASLENE